MSRVAVTESVLRWVVNRASLPPDALQHKFPRILQWLAGESKPTLHQLESLAKATFTPLGFFFLKDPPEEHLPIPHFRTLGDDAPRKPSPNLLETIQVMQQRQAWMRDFMIEQGQDSLLFAGFSKKKDSPASIANYMRKVLDFTEDWANKSPTWTDALRMLRKSIEDVGIIVVVNGVVGNNTHRKLDVEEFRGFVLFDEYAPLVFVNGVDGKAAQMFTLAHELAHVFLGSSAAFDLRAMQPASDPMEQICNQVAAEFLVPERLLHEIWQSVKNKSEPFQAIARRFKVSELVVARRALDLKLIQKKEFLGFYRDYQKHEHRLAAKRSGGGDFYVNQDVRVGRRFASTVIRAVTEGKLLYSEAYRLTGLYGKTFSEYAATFQEKGK